MKTSNLGRAGRAALLMVMVVTLASPAAAQTQDAPQLAEAIPALDFAWLAQMGLIAAALAGFVPRLAAVVAPLYALLPAEWRWLPGGALVAIGVASNAIASEPTVEGALIGLGLGAAALLVARSPGATAP